MEEVGGSSEGCCTVLELNIDAVHFVIWVFLNLFWCNVLIFEQNFLRKNLSVHRLRFTQFIPRTIYTMANEQNSAIFQAPKLRPEELEDQDFLIAAVQKMSKKLDRERRRTLQELQRNIKLRKNDLISARSLVPPSESYTAPSVIQARTILEDSHRELQQFNSEHSTEGYLEKIGLNVRNFHHSKHSVEKSVWKDWEGPQSVDRNDQSVWSSELGGTVDQSSCQVQLVKHKRHWDPTTNPRGLIVQTDKLLVVPVTMTMPEKMREERKVNPMLDTSPSVAHGSDEFVRPLGMKRSKYHARREFNFMYGKLYGDMIKDSHVDHPKYGTPFKTQQIVRTVLDRAIDTLDKELKKYPKFGLTAKQQKPKAEAKKSKAELERCLKESTGTRAKALERSVADAKKRVKAKLGMMMALKKKGFGDFSFLQKINEEVKSHTTPRVESVGGIKAVDGLGGSKKK